VAGDKSDAAARGAWIVFEDEAGQGLRPPKARTWARRGDTPVVAVSGRGSGRVSMAGLVCAKVGERTRMFYRVRVYHRRKGEPKGLSEHDYAQLLRAAHHQLGGAPIVCVWDNDHAHTSQTMRQFINAHDWLTVYQLPTYAPELNWAEGVWANVKAALGNLTARGIDQLAATVKSLLKRIQYRPGLIDGFIAGTGLALEPRPP
jgi:transposase